MDCHANICIIPRSSKSCNHLLFILKESIIYCCSVAELLALSLIANVYVSVFLYFQLNFLLCMRIAYFLSF